MTSLAKILVGIGIFLSCVVVMALFGQWYEYKDVFQVASTISIGSLSAIFADKIIDCIKKN